jgi:hypothetical protein
MHPRPSADTSRLLFPDPSARCFVRIGCTELSLDSVGFRRSTLPSIVIVPLSIRLSTHDETAVHRNGLAGYVACGVTAKPQNSICNLFGAANASHRDALLHRLEGLRPDRPRPSGPTSGFGLDRTYGTDANASAGVFESRALGEPDYSVRGGVICSSLGASQKSPERRAMDEGAASLLAHLLQFKFHATPYSAQIAIASSERHRLRRNGWRALCDPEQFVVGRTELPESGGRLFHQSGRQSSRSGRGSKRPRK